MAGNGTFQTATTVSANGYLGIYFCRLSSYQLKLLIYDSHGLVFEADNPRKAPWKPSTFFFLQSLFQIWLKTNKKKTFDSLLNPFGNQSLLETQ